MRHIKSYANDNAIQEAVDSQALGKPYVALDENTGKIDWNNKDLLPTGPFSLQLVASGTSIETIQGTEDEYGRYVWNNLGVYEATQFSILDGVGNPITAPHYSACGHNIDTCGGFVNGEGGIDPGTGELVECLEENNVLMSRKWTVCRINDVFYNINTDGSVQVSTGQDESTPESICNCQGGTWDGTDCIFGGGGTGESEPIGGDDED